MKSDAHGLLMVMEGKLSGTQERERLILTSYVGVFTLEAVFALVFEGCEKWGGREYSVEGTVCRKVRRQEVPGRFRNYRCYEQRAGLQGRGLGRGKRR